VVVEDYPLEGCSQEALQKELVGARLVAGNLLPGKAAAQLEQ
jgi:hypothetical protein